mgnify:FL=1
MEMLPKGTKFIDRKQKFILPAPWHSECQIKSAETGVSAFTAERILAAWFDEEREGDDGLQVWKETMRRTKPGWPLRMFMTVTPIYGYSWSYDYLWLEDSPRRFPGTESFNFTLFDACVSHGGFLSQAEVDDAISKCRDANDYKIRILGQYALIHGSPAFDSDTMLKALGKCRPGTRYHVKPGVTKDGLVAPILEENPEGALVILVPPEPGQEYILGADPAMGIRKDNSVASVWNRQFPIECAYFKSDTMEPARFAREGIAPIGTYYNNAMAAVESNSEAGGACLATLRGCYGHLYMQQNFISSTREWRRRYGFQTTGHSRGLVFDAIKDVMRTEEFSASEDFMREAMGMIVDKSNKIDHMDGRHDDHVMAAGIALAVSRMNPRPSYEPWETYREDYAGEDAWMGF